MLYVLAGCGAFGQAAQTSPAFAVASVKPDTVGTNEGPGRGNEAIESTPLSLTMRNIRLRSALKWAYHVQTEQVSGPAWLDSERYAIIAKAGEPVSEERLRLMLQPLLTERFQIKLHRESREMPVFVLLVDKSGPKFQPSVEAAKAALGMALPRK